MFTLAHLSDVHLTPLLSPRMRELVNKRLVGYLNWRFSRKVQHRREVLDRLTADVLARAPDHIAVGGDLINLGLPDEFVQAAEWLKTLGPPSRVTVVPGNHDTYVTVPREAGLERWAAYMRSDAAGAKSAPKSTDGFPFVRRFGRVAVIGLCTALPTPPFFAAGYLGEFQRDALAELLERFGRKGLFRVVLMHHPPLPGQASKRRALRDAGDMQDILQTHGAELVLHGHNHRHTVTIFQSKNRPVPVVGVPSASAGREKHTPLARYNLYRISEAGRGWRCELRSRGMKTPEGPVTEIERRVLIG